MGRTSASGSRDGHRPGRRRRARSAPSRTPWRSVAIVVAVVLASGAAGPARGADELTARSEARVHLDRARASAAAGQWDVALAEYTRSSALEPSAVALEGIARAHQARHEQAAALHAYEALLRDYASSLGGAARREAEVRVAALQRSTGSLVVAIEPSGARVEFDGAYLGTTPIYAPVRADPGTHRVRATKPGSQALDLTVTVAAGAIATASGTLAPLGAMPRATPPGSAGSDATSARTDPASAPRVPIDLSILDRHGTIAIDGRVVGEGDYRGDAPAGPHVIRVTRPGFVPFEKRIVLVPGTPFADVVVLVPAASAPKAPPRSPPREAARVAAAPAPATPPAPAVGPRTPPAPAAAPDAVQVEPSPPDAMRGVYGGMAAELTLQPGGTHGDVCSVPGVTRCSMSNPIGGGLLGYVGYMADPLGVDVLFGFQADAASVTATAAGQSATVVIPRIGGILALRTRLAWQTPPVRVSLAAGLGFAFRDVGLVAGGLSTSTYWAPAVTVEGALRFRLSPAAALSFGLLFWAENAENSVLLQIKPFPTSAHVLRSTQTLVMPIVGIEFGP